MNRAKEDGSSLINHALLLAGRLYRPAAIQGGVDALLAASPPYLQPVWRMFLSTGKRHDELVELTFDDIDFGQGITVVRASAAKNHNAREIPLDGELLATLAELRDQAARRTPRLGRPRRSFSRDHVFVTRAGTP